MCAWQGGAASGWITLNRPHSDDGGGWGRGRGEVSVCCQPALRWLTAEGLRDEAGSHRSLLGKG